MKHEWTPEQLAKLTPGCSVAFARDGEVGRIVATGVEYGAGDDTREGSRIVWDQLGDDYESEPLDRCDPSTVRPPTLKTLTTMATAKQVPHGRHLAARAAGGEVVSVLFGCPKCGATLQWSGADCERCNHTSKGEWIDWPTSEGVWWVRENDTATPVPVIVGPRFGVPLVVHSLGVHMYSPDPTRPRKFQRAVIQEPRV